MRSRNNATVSMNKKKEINSRSFCSDVEPEPPEGTVTALPSSPTLLWDVLH